MGVAANSDSINAGTAGLAETENATAINFGLVGVAALSEYENRAGYFEVYEEDSTSTANNYAIYAVAENTDSNFYAGYFEGNLVYTGALIGPSDAKLKENIEPLDDALSLILQMEPKQYEFKTDEYALSMPEGERHFGLIAADLKKIAPELVHTVVAPEHRKFTDSSSIEPRPQIRYEGVNYIEIIPMLVGAVQQMKASNDSLRQELADLKEDVNQCCGTGYRLSNPEEGDTVSHLTVELANIREIILEQNVPNPFKEQTIISYFVPDDAQSAQLIFFDQNGKHLKTVDVEKGYGIMTVFAQNLNSGTYSYSLVINGEVAETKRMIKMR